MDAPAWNNVLRMSTASRLLRYVFRNAPASRAGISEALGISPAMVTTITSTLIAQGLITDLGETEQSAAGLAGRKRILIGINHAARFSVGVELTKNHVCFCLTNLSGEAALRERKSHEELCGSDINEKLSSGINSFLENAQCEHESILGVGIALPGHYDEVERIFISHAGQWPEFSPERISSSTRLPVTCENNVRAMAYQKYMFDTAHCPENFVLIHVGAGIVCAQFSGGLLVVGDNVISGEIGHTIANPDGQMCECGKLGCLQTYSSESWLIKKAKIIYESSPQTALRVMAPSPEELGIDTIMAAYELGDEMVSRVVRDAVKYLGVAIANIAIIMSPQKLYIHGNLPARPAIRDDLKALVESQLTFVKKTFAAEICVLEYSPERGAEGAAATAIDRLLIQRQG